MSLELWVNRKPLKLTDQLPTTENTRRLRSDERLLHKHHLNLIHTYVPHFMSSHPAPRRKLCIARELARYYQSTHTVLIWVKKR
jgi:hypothetical protein